MVNNALLYESWKSRRKKMSDPQGVNADISDIKFGLTPKFLQGSPSMPDCSGEGGACAKNTACGSKSGSTELGPEQIFGKGAKFDPKTGNIDTSNITEHQTMGGLSNMISDIMGKYTTQTNRMNAVAAGQLKNCKTSSFKQSGLSLVNIGTMEANSSSGCFQAALNSSLMLNAIDRSLCQLQEACQCVSTNAKAVNIAKIEDSETPCGVTIDQKATMQVTANSEMMTKFKQVATAQINMANTLSQLASNSLKNTATDGRLNPNNTTVSQMTSNNNAQFGVIKTSHNSIQRAVSKVNTSLNAINVATYTRNHNPIFNPKQLKILTTGMSPTDKIAFIKQLCDMQKSLTITQNADITLKVSAIMTAAFEASDSFSASMENKADQTAKNSSDMKASGGNAGLIAAIVILSILFLAAVGGGIYWFMSQAKKDRQVRNQLTRQLVNKNKPMSTDTGSMLSTDSSPMDARRLSL